MNKDIVDRVHALLKDAKPGVPVAIPPEFAVERARPALEAIRRRERNISRALLVLSMMGIVWSGMLIWWSTSVLMD